MAQKAFFFDIDGTLYQNKFHEVSPKTIWALRRLLEQDNPVYLVSSRSLHEMDHLPEEFSSMLFTGLVLEGGALVLDERRNPVSSHTLNEQDVKRVSEFCRKNNLTWRYSTLEGNYFAVQAPQKIHRNMFNLYLCAPEYKPYQGEEVYNILIWTADSDLHKQAAELFKDFSVVEYEGCLELRNPDTSKEAEVEKICRQNRYEKSIAFGDGANDAGMLRFADLGVAVGNAYEPAKEAADVICGSIDEDGLAEYLESRHWV